MKGIPRIVRNQSGDEVAGLVRPSPVLPNGRSRDNPLSPYEGLNTEEQRRVREAVGLPTKPPAASGRS